MTNGGPALSFLTPYWHGREMMEIHLASLHRFHPGAPILVSKKGGEREEMEVHRQRFGVRYWMEDCSHTDAVLRLLARCRTRYACVLDHDVVLLASLDRHVEDIARGAYDLLGFEERIREPAALRAAHIAPGYNGWLRLAPGSTGVNFLLFDLYAFLDRWGLRGVRGTPTAGAKDFEYDFGIGQKLPRHHYVRPYHTARYGMGNLLMDGEDAVAWHQWYGSHGRRLDPSVEGHAVEPGIELRREYVARTERAFLDDYPALDLSGLTPAWGPGLDVEAELLAVQESEDRPEGRGFAARLRHWGAVGPGGLARRAIARLRRWWLLVDPRVRWRARG